MKALVPNTFRNGGIVDGEDINDNLRAIAEDLNRNLSRRFTYSTVVIPLDGMADTDSAEARTIRMKPPLAGGGYVFSIAAVELSIYAAVGRTWTLTIDDGVNVAQTLDVATVSATAEGYGITDRDHTMVDPTPLVLSLAASGGSTITKGSIILTLRCDRGIQPAADLTPYTPTLVDASTSSAASVLNNELTALGLIVNNDAVALLDIRCECVLLRKSAAVHTWALPSGAGRTPLNVQCSIVAALGESCTFAVTSGSVVVNAIDVNTTAVGSFVQAAAADGPTNTVNDTTATLTPAGGSVELAYAFIWWS